VFVIGQLGQLAYTHADAVLFVLALTAVVLLMLAGGRRG
jgi:hypothetical protein